jgi:aspartate racemase
VNYKLTGKKMKTVGILGGMGPYASCSFLHLLLNKTPAARDSDHLHIVLDSNPHIPSRTRAVLYGEESPLEGMIDACRRLAGYPVDVVVLPCNSAAAWLESLKERISVPILDIIKITTEALQDAVFRSSPKSVAVWGGWVTYHKETYRSHLENKGYLYIQHPEDIQKKIEVFISEIKLNRLSDGLFREINVLSEYFIKELKVDHIILGCTEFGCLPQEVYKFPCVNSLSCYAEYIVNYAKS